MSSDGPTWVRVGPNVALIGYPLRRRYKAPYVPTWLVLGPLVEGARPRPTLGSGVVDVAPDGIASLRVIEGQLPDDLAPALLEAAQSLVNERRRVRD